ncbi:MAG TPA: TIGR02266 family protein [Kofleriaceae bacterium]|nr:TIGR02266 family protein [Kofleriaceae bacterium]
MVDSNTRQGKRTPVTLKIKFKSETLEQFIERYAVDVSQGGIFIRTKEPLAVGTQMKFEFQLRDASPLIAGEGTVVWTRENDPSRPAIAPGMGVRFDRLADGSQGILERILTEKLKQAPQRPQSDTAKPPMFTDTPTRVAPAPIQDALLGKEGRQRRGSDDPQADSHTPLPKPMPFHSDADEFPDEAFEEATKVRALDELIAQTAEGATVQEDTGARRPNGRSDAAAAELAQPEAGGSGRGAAAVEPFEAPGLPNPPDGMRPQPRQLDTSPSPRIEPPQPAFVTEGLARSRLGAEPSRRGPGPSAPPPSPATPGGGIPMYEAPPMPSGVRAIAHEQTEPARLPPMRRRSNAPTAILILLLVAIAGAAVWFFVIRPQATEQRVEQATPAPGSAVATPGSATTGSATPGSASEGSATGSAAAAGSNAPKADLAETVIASTIDGASVSIVGTDQSGPAPFTAKLELGKPYKVRISARGFATLEMDLKGGDDKQTAKLVPKPHVITIDSDPPGAQIFVDSGATGHVTPFEVELTSAQAAKKAVRIQLRKYGFRTIDRVIDQAKFSEDDTHMVAKLDEKLTVQVQTPGGTRGSAAGAARGSAHEGSDAGSDGSSSSGATTGSGAGSTGAGQGGAGGSSGAGGAGGSSNPGGSGGSGGASGPGGAGGPGGASGPSGSPPGGSAPGGAGGASSGGGGASSGGTGSAAEPEPEFNKRP